MRVPDEISITWIGHSTVLIELDGARLLTDPVLRDRVGHLQRLLPSPSPVAIGSLDAVLLSHLHADHADLPSLRAVALRGPILAPPAACAWLADRAGAATVAVGAGEQVALANGVRVEATPALHDGRRLPFGAAAEAVGFLIKGSRTIYFAGDTDLYPSMTELRGRVDVALLPVWGWGPRVGPGHLDPERAAQATALIAPRIAVPIHWGTFTVRSPAKRPADPAAPARLFAELVARTAPGVEVRLMRPGDSLRLGPAREQ
jgi:L-ascorbate metabolism protein UlaG (beta-lactamase superfamily)